MLCKKCGLEMSCAGDKESDKLTDVLGMDYYHADGSKALGMHPVWLYIDHYLQV